MEMDHRAPPSPPPAAVLPVPLRRRRSARRRTPRSPRQRAAAILVLVAVPHPAAAALPAPSAPCRQIPAPQAPAAAVDADADNLMLLAHTAVSQPEAEAEAASPSPPAPAPAGEKRRRLRRSSESLPPPAAAEDDQEKPYAPPLPPPPAAVDEPEPSCFSIGHGEAATEATAGDYTEAARPQPQENAAGSSEGDQQHGGGGVASPAAAASPEPQPQPADDDEEEELEPGEIPPEKPAAGARRKADSAARESSSILGKYKGKPAAEEKRLREVFVGGLSRDAEEVDVRAALSAAGEITQVRMFVDRATSKSKDYCFVDYRNAAMASKAVAELGNVKICGKPCRLAVPEANEKTNKNAQRDPIIEDYNHIYEQGQPSAPILDAPPYIASFWDHHARHEKTVCSSSFKYLVPPVIASPGGGYCYPMYQNGNRMYLPPRDLNHGLAGPSGRSQIGQSGSSRPAAGNPHRNRN